MPAPNPVQRRAQRVSDSLIDPCAAEGGTFRDSAPARQPARRTQRDRDLGAIWLAVCVLMVVGTVLYAVANS